MAFSVKQIDEFYLLDTKVENIFINEFMTSAPGDYVKVYLLSLMYATSGTDADNALIAKQLSIEEEDVLKAWNYWEGLGAVRKNYTAGGDKFRYDIEFLCMKERLYGKKAGKKPTGDVKLPELLNDKELENLYRSIERVTGRLIGGKEPVEIASWIKDFGATPEVILYAYSYCTKNKKKSDYKYVGTVVKEWTEKQFSNVSLIENHLQEVDERHFLYKRVLKAMGFSRNATEKEKQLMDAWFDEMGLSIEKVLEACSKTSGISNPNFNYVNQILINWNTEKTGGEKPGAANSRKTVSVAAVHKYYDVIRKQAENEAAGRRAQIYSQIPEIKEIDETLRDVIIEMSKMMISNSNKKNQSVQYKSKVEELSAKKATLLSKEGYPADYTETKYRCEICKDSGLDDSGERCSCFKLIQKEAETWQNSLKN